MDMLAFRPETAIRISMCFLETVSTLSNGRLPRGTSNVVGPTERLTH